MSTLVVQMGHCYRKSGATGTNGEQAFATAAAERCVALLNGRGGWTVRRILADEASSAYRGDAFVAIHCDGSTNSAARGASIGYRTPEGQAFGQAWKRAYAARGWPGFRPDNYTAALSQYYGTGIAVAQGNRRALIVECGFLTNSADRALLTSPGGAERVALAIGDALGIPTGQQPQEDDDMDPYERNVLERTSWRTDAIANMKPRIDAKLTPTGTGGPDDELHEDVEIVRQLGILQDHVAELSRNMDILVGRLPAQPPSEV